MPGQLAALAAQAQGAAGIPQPGTMPHAHPEAQSNQVLAALRAGNLSAAQLLQAIAMLSGVGGIGVEGGAGMQAMQAPGGAAPAPPSGDGGAIAQAYGLG